jgi:fructuronate reductase
VSLWLNPRTLARLQPGIVAPRYDRQAVGRGVVHLGPGAFHRVHQAWFLDRLLATDPRWGITAVSLRSPSLRDALGPQDGLYTLAVRDREASFQVIGSILEVLVAADGPEPVLARLAAVETRLVTLTVTEKGYCLGPDGTLDFAHPDIVHDRAAPAAPRSVPGWIVAGLARRRDAGAPPFVTLSCDNLADNGAKLRAAVLALADAVDPTLAGWIAAEARFPGSMVDSITPATTEDLRERVARATGLRDRWPVQREAWVQWVIEAEAATAGLDWAAAGVTLSSNVAAHERAKLRVLNAAHSTLAYLGLLAGHRTVAQAIADERLLGFVRAMLAEDVLGTLPGELDWTVYVEQVLERFRNPVIVHRLAQIAIDGSQKLPVRLFGTVHDALARGAPLDRLAVAVAAWLHWLRQGTAAGEALDDPLAATLQAVARACDGDPVADVDRWLELRAVFGDELPRAEPFRRALCVAYDRVGRWPAGQLT